MRIYPFLLSSALYLIAPTAIQAQQAEKTPPATPNPAENPAATPIPGNPAAPAPPVPPSAPAPPPKTPEQLAIENKAINFIEACIKRIDTITYVSAELREVIYVADRTIESTGIYLRGPDQRMRLELEVDIGDAVGKRIQVSDGKTGFQFRRILEQEDVWRVDLSQVLPVLAQKDLPPVLRREMLAQLPLLEPGQMLRGYLDEVVFTAVSNRRLGDETAGRPVTVVEGHWNQRVVDTLVGKPTGGDVNALGGSMPQYVRLVLDDESGWPLRVELFRRDKRAEFEPVFVLEFNKLVLNEPIADEKFSFIPPEKLNPQDVTGIWLARLQQLPNKPVTPAPGVTPASAPSAGAVSAPIRLPKP